MRLNERIGRIRLATGLILFAFVLTHDFNHTLGLISLAAMEAGRRVFLGFWNFPPIQAAFVAAILIHVGLALRTLYRRRSLRMPHWEGLQLLFGLAVPPLLLLHVLSTVAASRVFGVGDSYAFVLIGIWSQAPGLVILQSAALLVAWIHGCLGLYYWLRLKLWFPAWRSAFLVAAWLLPLLAWLGFAIAGREVLANLNEPGWLAAIAKRDRFPTAAAAAAVYHWRDLGLVLYAMLIMAVLAARAVRDWLSAQRAILVAYPGGITVKVQPGTTLLEASRIAAIPHASVCGGRGRCSTCRVRVIAGERHLSPVSEAEGKVLKRVGAAPGTRLACQATPSDRVTIEPLLPAHPGPRQAGPQADYHAGKELEIAVLFADIRGFTRLAEQRLPYDIVFLLNRYFRDMAAAVTAAGGHVDKFIGDGVMALFGLQGRAELAPAQAVEAARRMAEALLGFNLAFRADLPAPVRIGIGIHFGPAVIGDMGVGLSHGVTAIGDTVNIASRLEAATKEFGCQILISASAAALAGLDLAAYPRHEVGLRGREQAIAAIAIPDGRALKR